MIIQLLSECFIFSDSELTLTIAELINRVTCVFVVNNNVMFRNLTK